MVAHHARLHGMTNNPTKYEHILSNSFREVAFTNCQGQPLLPIPFLTVFIPPLDESRGYIGILMSVRHSVTLLVSG